MKNSPPGTTCKDVEKGVDVDDKDNNGRNGQDGNVKDIKNADKRNGQDIDGEDRQDDNGENGQNKDRKHNQDGNSGNTLDVNLIQLRKAEKRKLTFLMIIHMVKAEKRVKHTSSTFSVNVTSINILKHVFAYLFGAFDTDHAILIVPDTPPVSAIDTTFAKPYINPNILFEEWSLCNFCSPNVVSAEPWCKQICNCYNREFLDAIYMLGCDKYMLFNVYNHYLYLLVLNLHLMDTLLAKLCLKIDLIWEH